MREHLISEAVFPSIIFSLSIFYCALMTHINVLNYLAIIFRYPKQCGAVAGRLFMLIAVINYLFLVAVQWWAPDKVNTKACVTHYSDRIRQRV